MPKTLVGWAFLIIVLIVIFKNPAQSAATVHGWITSATTFVTGLVG
jgi:hypothetical protein